FRPPNFQFQTLRQRIDAAYAHAVQTAGYLVAVAVELTPGMQLGHDYLRRRDSLFLMNVHWNAAAVIDYGDRIVVVDDYIDFGSMPGQGFVHRIIDHFVDQVMQ